MGRKQEISAETTTTGYFADGTLETLRVVLRLVDFLRKKTRKSYEYLVWSP